MAPESVAITWTQLYEFEETADARSIWARGPSDVYVGYDAVPKGQTSSLLHYDGQSWTSVDVPPSVGYVLEVWGSESGNLYMREDSMWRRVNGIWEEMPVDPGYITGTGNDVFIGSGNYVTHFNGTAWDTLLTVPRFVRSIYALPGPDLIVASNDSLLRWDGIGWNRSPSFGFVDAMWGTSSDDVFAVGATQSPLGESAAWHWNGATWLEQTITTPIGWLQAVSGSAGQLIALSSGAALSFQGADWTLMSLPTSRRMGCLQFLAPDDVIFAGQDDKILRREGSIWTSPRDGGPTSASAIWMDTPSTIFVAEEHSFTGSQSVYRLESGTWREEALQNRIVAMCGTSPHDVYAASSGPILHFDGASWAVAFDSLYQPQQDISMADGVVFTVGTGSSYRFDGLSWTRIFDDDQILESVWAHSAEEAFAVGYDALLHFKEGVWKSILIDGEYPRDVWADPNGEAYVATGGGIYRYADGVLGRVTPRWFTTQITGTSPSDILAAQDQFVFHFDGVLWKPGDMQHAGFLSALGVSQDQTIFLVHRLFGVFDATYGLFIRTN